MNVEILDRIGEYNPQLYRELKGKLKPRNAIATVIISGLFQLFLLFWCSSDSDASLAVNWKQIYNALNWILPIFGIAIGVYLLSRDLCREKESGTLVFVRLSPQSSESILLGKLLGIPILLYFAVALTIPLHLTATLTTFPDLSVPEVLINFSAVYLVWVGLYSIFCNLALIMIFLRDSIKGLKLLPISCSAGSLISTPFILIPIAYFYLNFYRIEEIKDWDWFFLPNRFIYLWLLGTLFAPSFLLWQSANRRFRNPNSSLVSKVQSYWIVGGSQIWLLGFVLPQLLVEDREVGLSGLSFLIVHATVCLLVLAILMLPPLNPSFKKESDRRKEPEKPLGLRERLIEENGDIRAAVLFDFVILWILWLPGLAVNIFF